MLDTSSACSPDNTVEAPKDNQPARIASPPPAYAPPPMATIPLTLPQLTALRIQRAAAQAGYRNDTCTGSSTNSQRTLATTVLASHADEVDACDNYGAEQQEEAQSPICLRINTSVNITQSNNIVCLPDTPPAEHATSIANAVVKALQENSSGNCGIPMIDEDGRPRPIKIEVDASMLVEGSGNIVGSQPVVNEALRQRGLRRLRPTMEEDEGQDAASPSKRRRTSITE